MNEKLKIIEFLQILKKRLFIIILTTICFSGLVVLSSIYLIKPSYQFSTQILAGSLGGDPKELNRVQENRQLAISFMDIIQSPHIMLAVKEELNLNRSSYELLEEVSVTNKDNSQIITITVKDSNPQLAKDIAQSLARQSILSFKDYANIDNLRIFKDSEVENAKLLFPKLNFVAVISIVLGLFAGIGLALFRELFDDKTYSNKELERLGLPLAGRVNLNIKKNKQKRTTIYKQKSSIKAR
ncbi:YveK family protein [Rossellomorea sp. BNER]|uniref:YveK family protein n=1 Tax=Rossellomorea sp. BNER TaxID=2962031 RepID=UPI003AF20360|nr:Wzz/FepE/Etk N-terminal domain-containing protein [Rossellomorea sp. BNER]